MSHNDSPMLTVSNRRALVTGASSGLGEHFAHLLAQHGAHVVLAARRQHELQRVAESIRAAGGQASTVLLDLTDRASRDALVAAAGPIDILVNNAGVVSEGSALTQSEQEWDAVIDTNLKGMFFVAQAVARDMQQRGGSIINVASILGLRQAAGVLPYAVSKAGVIQMTKTLALELARYRIRVNALAPGYIETPLNQAFWDTPAGQALIKRVPQRRLGRLTDLDGPLLLLASDASRYMTGSTLVVDGGHLTSTL